MGKTYLLVHRHSYSYVKHATDYIWSQISSKSKNETEFLVCEEIDAVPIETTSTAFIIGDPFKRFKKIPDVRYIFLNFSVVVFLGGFFSFSLSAYRLITRKRRILESKISCFDHLLDFWPPQTEKLKVKFSKLNIRVDSLPLAILPFTQERMIPLEERKYDVCFVGGVNFRRKRILEKLKALGLKLSPTSGMSLEDAASQSRVVLNLHARRSNHLETPRILGAYAAGCAVVTENCYKIEEEFPSHTHLSCTYDEIPKNITDLLGDTNKLKLLARNGHDWLRNERLLDCDKKWTQLIASLEDKKQ